jgi:hypothetical protein
MKDLNQLYTDFKAKSEALKTLQKNTARIAGTVAVRVMRENFKAGGFIEEGKTPTEKWNDRLDKTNHAYNTYAAYKATGYSGTRPILKQSGKMFDAIESKPEGEHRVFIFINGNKCGYGKFVNERIRTGESGSPVQDKFIGGSKHLMEVIHANIVRRRLKIFGTWLKSNNVDVSKGDIAGVAGGSEIY